jgi:hypothetical protein
MAKPIRVIINNRDMLSWPKAMLEYLENVPNIIPVIIDNASTYPPLLEWYQTGPCEVLKVNQNLGHRAPCITREVFNNLERYYVVTDPDLDLSGVPTDLIDHLIEGLNLHPDKRKAGLSLEINDLPTDSPVYENAIKWETGFWNNLKTNGFYHSPVDTTFAVYDIQKELLPFIPCALRADRPALPRIPQSLHP